MELNRKGHCINFVNCPKADRKEIIELSFTEDFVCPECQQDLVEVVKKSINWKKILIPLVGVIVMGIIGWVLISVFAIKEKGTQIKGIVETSVKAADSLNHAVNDKIAEDAISTPAVPVSIPPAKEKITSTKREVEAVSKISPSSLEEYLQKIGDKEYPESDREVLIKSLLLKFESNQIQVKVLRGNEEFDYVAIGKYLSRIRIQGIKNITVNKAVKNNAGLINELEVSEKYQNE